MRIHLCGASGTGKTTLAEELGRRLDLPVLPSAARQSLADSGCSTWAELMADRDRFDQFQGRIMGIQMGLEDRHPDGYVADRAIDHAVYGALYSRTGHLQRESMAFANCVDRLKQRGTLLFLVPPVREIFDSACEDGHRKEFLVWEDVQQFHGALRYVLAAWEIPHTVLSPVTFKARSRFVIQAARAHYGRDAVDGRLEEAAKKRAAPVG